MMDNVVLMQTDSTWSSQKFGGGTVYGWACGAFAIANLMDLTDPQPVIDWLRNNDGVDSQYGTYHWAIIKCLKVLYNVACTRLTKENMIEHKSCDAFDKFSSEVESGFEGLAIMGHGNAIYDWQIGSGHYIAIKKAKRVDGVLYLYVEDSYYPTNTGWHPWTDFLGSIKHLFITDRRWKDAEATTQVVEEEDMKDYFEGITIDTSFTDIGGVRYAGKTMQVRIAPSDDAPQREEFGWLGIGNAVVMLAKTTNNYGLIHAAGDPSKVGWVWCQPLRKDKV